MIKLWQEFEMVYELDFSVGLRVSNGNSLRCSVLVIHTKPKDDSTI